MPVIIVRKATGVKIEPRPEPPSVKLRRNWLATHGTQPPAVSLDDSLTDLDWLINLDVTKFKQTVDESSAHNSTAAITQRDIIPEALQIPHTSILTNQDYKKVSKKPPYSYAKLISMAIQDSRQHKLVLSDIYKWISDNYLYYATAGTSWHNSVRHCLTMNKSFHKVARQYGDPGKGSFWAINAEHRDEFKDRMNVKRPWNTVDVQVVHATAKRIKQEKDHFNNSECQDLLSTAISMSAICNDDDDEPANISKPPVSVKYPLGNVANKINTPMTRKIQITKAAPMKGVSILKKPQENPNSKANSIYSTIDDKWSTVLRNDIEIGGKKMKTEDIIDDNVSSELENCGLPLDTEDLLLTDLDPSLIDTPLDLTNYMPLQMKSLDHNDNRFWNEDADSEHRSSTPTGDSRMNTPTALSGNEDSQPWSDDLTPDENTMTFFDKDFSSIFDMMDDLPGQDINCVF